MSCSTSEKIVKIGAYLRKLSQKRNRGTVFIGTPCIHHSPCHTVFYKL